MTAASQGRDGTQPMVVEVDVAAGEALAALAAADSLADKGQFLDALELLTDADRPQRNTEIEARLIYLRNAAYEELDRSPTDSPWPDDAPRERDHAEALPAIEPRDLTPELVRDQILRYGCAYVRGLVSRRQAQQLADGIDRAFEGHDRQFPDPPEDPDPNTAPWYVPFEPPDGQEIAPGQEIGDTRKWVRKGGGVFTIESPRVMFDFLDMLGDIGLDSVIAGYLGERPAMTLIKSALRRFPVIPGADWHQDVAVLGEGIRTINLWLTLSHCGDDAPGLDLVPRRLDHILETGTDGAHFPWSAGAEVVEQAAEDAPVLRPIFEPGDALLFDELFLHRTAVDLSMTKERYGIENWFFAPSHYPVGHTPFVW
jgi:hypothetical protein